MYFLTVKVDGKEVTRRYGAVTIVEVRLSDGGTVALMDVKESHHIRIQSDAVHISCDGKSPVVVTDATLACLKIHLSDGTVLTCTDANSIDIIVSEESGMDAWYTEAPAVRGRWPQTVGAPYRMDS